MPEKTKRNKADKNTAKKQIAELPEELSEDKAKDTWSQDQQEKSYYYDDSYGYEIYNPDEDEENDELKTIKVE